MSPAYKEEETMTHTTTIGIDVSKHQLDAFCSFDQATLTVPNHAKGIITLLKWVAAKDAHPLVILEPTGGYEHTCKACC